MAQFECINGCYINLDCIKEFHETKGSKIAIKYKDGSVERIPGTYLDTLSGFSTIVQVIPCAKPLYAAYGEDGVICGEDKVYYLGLCADGVVRGLIMSDSCFEIADEISNFMGLYETSQYKAIEKGVD